MPDDDKVKPTYMKGRKSADIALRDFVEALDMMRRHGHYETFQRQAREAGALPVAVDMHDLLDFVAPPQGRSVRPAAATVKVPPKTANFVKDFVVANNMHEDPIGRTIVNASCPDFECKFGR